MMYGSGEDEGGDYIDGPFGFEEYAMDDSMDPVSQLERYSTAEFSVQRLVLARDLLSTVRSVSLDDAHTRVLPLLKPFSTDSEPAVREVFIEQLAGLARYFVEEDGQRGYESVLTTFLTINLSLVLDKNVQVGAAAVQSVVALGELVEDKDVEEHLLEPSAKYAKDTRAEDYRIVAAQMLNGMASKLGKERCLEKVVEELERLSDDDSQSVRKTVVSNLGNLMDVLGPELGTEKVFPLWRKLAEDKVWGVRKAAIEECLSIASKVTPAAKNGEFLEVYLKLREDPNRWVSVSANQKLGELIHVFGGEGSEIPPILVSSFQELAPGDTDVENEYSEFCAFNLPAVAHAVGEAGWPGLEKSYEKLIRDVQWKVRRSLSFSLHEIAAVVPASVHNDILIGAYEQFLEDLDEVKCGCLENLTKFVGFLPADLRPRALKPIVTLAEESENWRIRELIAAGFEGLAGLFESEQCKSLLQPAVLQLCEDHVANVRSAAFPAAAAVLKRLAERDLQEEMKEKIMALQAAEHFRKRQIFCHIAGECLRVNVEVDAFAAKMEACVSDPVPNVRLVLATCAIACPDLPAAQSLKEKLQDDADGDVQRVLNASATDST